jgi:hypothetical protein
MRQPFQGQYLGFQQQPPLGVQVDWGSPFAKHLTFAFIARKWDQSQATGQVVPPYAFFDYAQGRQSTTGNISGVPSSFLVPGFGGYSWAGAGIIFGAPIGPDVTSVFWSAVLVLNFAATGQTMNLLSTIRGAGNNGWLIRAQNGGSSSTFDVTSNITTTAFSNGLQTTGLQCIGVTQEASFTATGVLRLFRNGVLLESQTPGDTITPNAIRQITLMQSSTNITNVNMLAAFFYRQALDNGSMQELTMNPYIVFKSPVRYVNIPIALSVSPDTLTQPSIRPFRQVAPRAAIRLQYLQNTAQDESAPEGTISTPPRVAPWVVRYGLRIQHLQNPALDVPEEDTAHNTPPTVKPWLQRYNLATVAPMYLRNVALDDSYPPPTPDMSTAIRMIFRTSTERFGRYSIG